MAPRRQLAVVPDAPPPADFEQPSIRKAIARELVRTLAREAAREYLRQTTDDELALEEFEPR